MKTTFTIIGSIFGLTSGVAFNFAHIYLGISFVVLAIISFVVALCANLNKNKSAKKEKNEINIQEFTFIDPPGYYTHPKYSYWICPFCLIDKGRISPVSKTDKNFWCCNVCNKHLSGSRGEAFTVKEQSHNTPLEEIKINILLFISKYGVGHVQEIASTFKIELQTALFHLEELQDAALVSSSDYETSWCLEQGGRKYLVKNKLIP